ncbi:MAG: hypothetical protein Q9219_001380 [cf. Caloplaca sp. 3 TL-2023]
MSQPKTWSEVCDAIAEISKSAVWESRQAYREALGKNFAKFQARFGSIMEDKSVGDLIEYLGKKAEDRCLAPLNAPPITIEAFWSNVHDLDIFSPTSGSNDFRKLLSSPNRPLVPLGKVYGTHQLWLLPELGSLPAAELDQEIPLDFVATNCSAISYPDGHPSEQEIVMVVPGETDQKLRRFVSLGYVVQGTSKNYRLTGHALVADVEKGRNLHPWIVLASTFPNDNMDDHYGSETIVVPEEVDRDDSEDEDEYGVLPGDNNRTPVGKIIPIGETTTEPVITLLGLNFNFTVLRRGSSRGYTRSPKGPSLANVMDWYLDPATQDQICFLKGGEEYMRFNPTTLEISYSPQARNVYDGQHGFFGEITGPRQSVSLPAQTGPAADPTQQHRTSHHSGDISMTPGF